MSRLITLRGGTYAVGLDWHLLGAGVTVSKLVKQTKVKAGARAPRSVGLVPMGQKGQALVGKPSAAALLAHSVADNLLVVEELNDGSYWLGAVQGGAVLAEGDYVGQAPEIETRVNDLLSLGEAYRFAGSAIHEFVVDAEPGGPTFTDLIRRGRVAASRVKPLTLTPAQLLGLAFVPVLLAGAYFGVSALLSEPAPTGPSIEERRAMARQELERQVATLLASPTMRELVEGVGGLLDTVPMRPGGWLFTGIQCKADGACVAAWDKEQSDDLKTLADALGRPLEEFNYGMDGGGAALALRWREAPPAIDRQVLGTLQRHGEQQPALIDLFYELRATGLDAQLEQAQEIPSGGAYPPGQGYRRGVFRIGGPDWLLPALVERLEASGLSGLRGQGIKINIQSSNVSWEVEGIYVSR